MALLSPNIHAYALDLHYAEAIIDELHIQTVPVTWVDGRRIDGPVTEWLLAQQVTASP